jgi:glycosyltransferase involved in cell wall biosynthesis
MDLPEMPGVCVLGTITDEEKWDVLAAASALVHPSRHESFALILLESWCVATPSLVNAYSEVMAGHSRRSGGGLWYRSYADFEACMDRLLTDPDLATGLGRQGKRYVETNYAWDGVIDRYLSFLERVREPRP